MRLLILLSLLALSALSVYSQNDGSLYQLHGRIHDKETKKDIPFAHIVINKTARGTVSNVAGIFTLPVHAGDSLLFSAVGFKTSYYVVPQKPDDQSWTVHLFLDRDTIHLDQVEIFPWPGKDQFKQAFLELQLSDGEYSISPYAGFHRVDNPTPVVPSIMSPISFFYEKIVKPIKRKKRKRKKAKELPVFE